MSAYKKYQCAICGHRYDAAQGDPDSGQPPGTRWEALPADWRCPACGTGKVILNEWPNGAE